MNKLKIIVPIICILIGVLIGRYWFPHQKLIVETRVDTVTVDKPVAVEKTVVQTQVVKIPKEVHDTIVSQSIRTVTVNDTVLLVLDRSQNHYKLEQCEAWVSGIDPCLDSIKVYNKVTTIVPKKKHKLGLYASIEYIHTDYRAVVPSLGVVWETPKGLEFRAGYCGDLQSRSSGFTAGVSYKLNLLK